MALRSPLRRKRLRRLRPIALRGWRVSQWRRGWVWIQGSRGRLIMGAGLMKFE
jgi:hypothetical protein